jgi:hypothetical protein
VAGLRPRAGGTTTSAVAVEETSGVPRWAPWFVHGLLAVVVICGLLRLELFPMSAFKLFSGLRHDEHKSWAIRAVDGEDETSIRLGDLPVGFRNTSSILNDFDDMSRRERDAVCAAWAEPLRHDGWTIDLVRIYRVTTSVRPGGPPPVSELRWECGHS